MPKLEGLTKVKIPKSIVALKAHARQVVKLLRKYYPKVKCSLNYNSPYQLLVATTLSAQCTDDRVNQVTPALFKKAPTPEKMSKLKLSEIENLIRSTGFYKNKAKSIKLCSEQLLDEHEGKVPQTLEELVKLGGVGRKTANVVLGNAFGIPGLVVDTHVTRLTNRLGLTKGKNAVILERNLCEIIDKKDWTDFAHLMISHGRAVCKARKPSCTTCFLEGICPKVGVTTFS